MLEKMKRLCSRGEKSPFAVRMKLREAGINEQIQNEIIEQLSAEDFINELRYARAYAHDKIRINLWGPEKVKAGLRVQRISSQSIQIALSEIDDELVEDNIKKIIGHKPCKFDYNSTSFQKVYRKLIAKGYSSSSIRNVID